MFQMLPLVEQLSGVRPWNSDVWLSQSSLLLSGLVQTALFPWLHTSSQAFVPSVSFQWDTWPGQAWAGADSGPVSSPSSQVLAGMNIYPSEFENIKEEYNVRGYPTICYFE